MHNRDDCVMLLRTLISEKHRSRVRAVSKALLMKRIYDNCPASTSLSASISNQSIFRIDARPDTSAMTACFIMLDPTSGSVRL
jgi:hypothetical protein